MSSGGASPGIVDLDTGRYREPGTRDLYDAARLVDALEHIHHFSRSLVARDAPDPYSMDVNTAYACLAGTSKPVSISITEPDHVASIADICYTIAGGGPGSITVAGSKIVMSASEPSRSVPFPAIDGTNERSRSAGR